MFFMLFIFVFVALFPWIRGGRTKTRRVCEKGSKCWNFVDPTITKHGEYSLSRNYVRRMCSLTSCGQMCRFFVQRYSIFAFFSLKVVIENAPGNCTSIACISKKLIVIFLP